MTAPVKPLTPAALDELLVRLCDVPIPSAPSISPDGATIVYSLAEPGGPDGRDVHSLWLVDCATGQRRRLTEGPADTAPRLAPDGARLAFLRSSGDAAPQLWTMPLTGGPATRLTDLGLGAGAAEWSPDGSRIAFAATVELPDARGAAPGAGDPVVVTRPGYRFDGVGLRGSRRQHVFVLTVQTGEVEQLTDGDWLAYAPCWSPDGSRLAVIGIRGRGGDTPLSAAPYVLRYEPGMTPVPEQVGAQDMVWTLCWDPAGDALVLGRLGPRSGTEPRLLRVPLSDPAAADAIDLLAGLDRGSTLVRPTALAGGGLLAGVTDGGIDKLYVVADGDEPPRHIPIDGEHRFPETVTAADAPYAALVVQTPRSYGEIGRVELRTGELTVLTDSTATAVAGIDLPQPEPMRFRISDGTFVHGWLLRGGGPGRAAPLLLDVHGGPAGDWGPALDVAFPYQQALVAAGWNVLLLNPRGSRGYGDAFHAAAYGRQGLEDERDFLEPIDQLEAAGLVDAAEVYVTGYSYGGYMTCWLTARTRRFRAAVAGGLHCDLASLAGMSDVGPGLMELIYGGVPWRHADRVRSQSPIEYVAGVSAPTLIMQGEDDRRNPVGQAELWFNALYDLGVDCELVIYPGADHMFPWSGRRAHRLDYARRTVAWLQEHRP